MNEKSFSIITIYPKADGEDLYSLLGASFNVYPMTSYEGWYEHLKYNFTLSKDFIGKDYFIWKNLYNKEYIDPNDPTVIWEQKSINRIYTVSDKIELSSEDAPEENQDRLTLDFIATSRKKWHDTYLDSVKSIEKKYEEDSANLFPDFTNRGVMHEYIDYLKDNGEEIDPSKLSGNLAINLERTENLKKAAIQLRQDFNDFLNQYYTKLEIK